MYSFWNNSAPDYSKTSFSSDASDNLFSDPNFWCSDQRTEWLLAHKPEIINLHNEEPSQVLARQARILKEEFGISLDEGYLETPDGFQLHTMSLTPPGFFYGARRYMPGNQQGDLYIFVQGKSDSCSAMVPTMAEVVFAGNQAVTWDLRYQGRSGRLKENPQKVHGNDLIMEHGGDFQQTYKFIKSRIPKFGRCYIVAYSMGAAIAFMSLVHNLLPQEEIKHFYPVSPLIKAKELDTMRGKFLMAAAPLLCRGSLSQKYCFTTGDRNWLEEIEKRQHEYTRYPEQLVDVHEYCIIDKWNLSGGPTLGWIGMIGDYFSQLPTIPDNALSVPTTGIFAVDDEVVVNEAAVETFGRVAVEFTPEYFPERHAQEISVQGQLRTPRIEYWAGNLEYLMTKCRFNGWIIRRPFRLPEDHCPNVNA